MATLSNVPSIPVTRPAVFPGALQAPIRVLPLTPAAPAPRMPVAIHRPVGTRFGARLRALRKQKNYTQAELAEYLGIDRSHLSELENGHKNVSLCLLDVIAQGFKVSLSDLLDDI